VTNHARDIFVVGLRNAHSMEMQAKEQMERQTQRLTDYPEVRARVAQHLEETTAQLQRLEQCLEACGEQPSAFKDVAQALLGNTMALASAMAGDEILKNTFSNNAFEHFEIAAYKSLLAMCGPAGADTARPLLELSLSEERRMADWIDDNIEKITQQYLQAEQHRVG
jgi:ferritin-like metal-binding protein YciE